MVIGVLSPAMTHEQMLATFGISRSTLSRRVNADSSHPLADLKRKAWKKGTQLMYDPVDVAECVRLIKQRRVV